MGEPQLTILCSGVALGVYIPALLLESHLRRLGMRTDVALLEDLYHPDARASLERLRETFHDRFDLARMAQRMTRTIQPQLAPERAEALLRAWDRDGRRAFVVWSGFWMPLLETYRALRAPQPVHIDICRIDAAVSPSFAGYPTLSPDDREIWFWNGQAGRLEYELPVTSEAPIPYANREDRYVVHGGGWGLGEYRDAAEALRARGARLDRVIYRLDEAGPGETCRDFMVQPGWRPWLRPAGTRLEFPPFGEVRADGQGPFRSRETCHELYRNIRRCRAILSKPGGGTLMDSLASATPVVFLEPYGQAEQSNADLWIHLGFGVSYGEWARSGHDPEILARLADRLAGRPRTTIDYPRDCAEHFRRLWGTVDAASGDRRGGAGHAAV